MEREIKFRWFDKFNKKMVLDCIFGGDSMGINKQIKMFSNDLIPMQYTGLKDKNGKEIYEGDIVKSYSNGKLTEIKWGDVWGLDFQDEPSGVGFPMPQYSEMWEIIGNIHENPELLNNK